MRDAEGVLLAQLYPQLVALPMLSASFCCFGYHQQGILFHSRLALNGVCSKHFESAQEHFLPVGSESRQSDGEIPPLLAVSKKLSSMTLIQSVAARQVQAFRYVNHMITFCGILVSRKFRFTMKNQHFSANCSTIRHFLENL